ncbi:putative binding protein YtlA [uncultured Eubacteriales bacterium]|uniref:Putative binding protein YtlA n=1 Tax=uncultured Eubacteriales bacterium TaxID=172733 RepID=A0A212J556_9FIRM|nr:putative binding protein YtlA [uncultured Eubacteriales bacterium]
MKRLIALGLGIVLLTTLVSGCGKKEEVTKVRLNEVTHSVFYAPMYVALELGLFAEEGLNIELTNGGGADKVMTAVLAGQADIGLAGPEACLYVINEGREDYAVIFAQLTKRDGSFLVGRTDEDFTWENLKGKTIIGGRKGGVPEMTLEYVMRQNGIIPNQDAVVDTSVQFNMMAGAFTGGESDYVTLFEPTATEVELEGKGFVLTSIGQESGEIPYTAFFASQSYIKNNSIVVQSFTNAVAKGQKWVREHTAQEIAEALADQFPDTKIDVLTLVVQRYKDIDAWNETPVMKQESLERLEDVMETAGELDKRVDFNKLVDNSFAEETIK